MLLKILKNAVDDVFFLSSQKAFLKVSFVLMLNLKTKRAFVSLYST